MENRSFDFNFCSRTTDTKTKNMNRDGPTVAFLQVPIRFGFGIQSVISVGGLRAVLVGQLGCQVKVDYHSEISLLFCR